MKKIFKLITGIALSLAMAIGVDVGILSSINKKPVYADGETDSITIGVGSFSELGSNSYGSGAERTGSVTGANNGDSISLGGHYITSNNKNSPSGASAGTKLQCQGDNATIYNTSALPGRLISLTLTQSGTARAFSLYGGNSRLMASDNTATGQTPSGTKVTDVSTAATMTWNIPENNNYTFFAIKKGSSAGYVDSIVATYELPSGDSPTLENVTLSGSMSKTSYTTAESWDSTGLTVTGTYSDASSSDVTASATFSYYSDEAMTGAVATPSALGVGNDQTIYVKATVSGISNTVAKSQNVSVSAVVYSVTYNDNGATSGSAPTDATAYNNGATVTVLGNTGSLTKTGYIFGGWNTEADGTGTSYVAGNTFSISASTTLYARWLNDYANSASLSITAPYLNDLPTSSAAGLTSEKLLRADDGMEYVIAPSSGNKAYAITSTVSSGTDYAFDSNSLSKIFMGKAGAYLYNKDPLPRNIDKIEVYAAAGCSQSVAVAVDLGTTVRSSSYDTSPTTLSTQNHIYTFKENQGSNNYRFFRLQVTNGNNVNFQIRITFYNPTTSVTVTPESVTLAPTETQQLTTTVLPAGHTDGLIYSSDHPEIATVSNSGLVTAVADGTATITATSGSYSDTCVVTVETPVVPFVTLDSDSIGGYTGLSGTIPFLYGNLDSTLGASAKDAKATARIINDDDNGYAEVEISYVSAGSTEVYVKDGATTLATITVTITESTVVLSGLPATDSVLVGDTLDLLSKLDIANTGSCSDDLTWISANDSIATVNELGDVTGVAPGTVNITVTADDYPSATMTCAVKVTKQANSTSVKLLSADLTSTMSVTSGYTITSSNTKTGSGFYQDKGTADSDICSFVAKGTSPLFAFEAAEIKLVVRLAGGTAKNPLDHNIEACLVDDEGAEIAGTTVIVASALTTSATNFTVSIPYSASAYGVKVMHVKEDGWNARYYSFELSYSYTTSYATLLGTETGSGVESVAMIFSAKISVANWSALGTITDYGIMMFKRKASESEYSDTDTPVKDAYREGRTLTVSHKGSGVISPDGDYYIFSAKVNVNDSANYGVVVCAAPFVVVDGTYYFFDEMEYSVNTLALYHLANGGSSLSEDALNSLKGA